MKEKKSKKIVFITLGVIAASILLIGGMFVSTNNKAVNLEEQMNSATASIQVQEKRRVDLIANLVDTVSAYSKYESSTFTAVTKARQSASTGNIEEAKVAIQAVAEAYPNLKANANYTQLMTELSLTENLIAQQRNNFNIQVKSYNKFCRTFPNSMILNMMGYEKVSAAYTDYKASSDAPKNLFEGK